MRSRRVFVTSARSAVAAFSVVLAVTIPATARAQAAFVRGDVNADGQLDVSDPVFLLRYLFQGGLRPTCADAGDADDDGRLSVSDSVQVLAYLFRGGEPPPPPNETCGRDPTDDALGCESHAACVTERRVASLTAFTLTPSDRGEHLIYDGPLGFRRDVSFVRLWGRGLLDAQEIVLSDAFGFEQSLWRTGLGPIQEHPSGLESVAFHLHDEDRDVRLLFTDPRSSMGVEFVSARTRERSNRLEIPVVAGDDPGIPGIPGITINAVNVPTQPTLGRVWIEYSCYERVIDAAWMVHVDFSIDGGTTWFPALSAADEAANDGTNQIACGPLARHDGDLFPGGGAVRTFVWDACRDDGFLAFNDPDAPREWDVMFRLRPELETGHRAFFEHVVETPPVPYVYLPGCAGGDGDDPLRAAFVESFDDATLLDVDATSALWNAPPDAGTLRAARIDAGDPFGAGTENLVLAPRVDPDAPPEGFVEEYYELDTDDLSFTHHELAFRVDSEPDDTATPIELANPGADDGELWLARLTSEAGARVVATGSRPLVVRLAGSGPDTPDDEVVLRIDGELDLSGADGQGGGHEDLALEIAGAGGRGGPGGGRGGDGGRVTLEGANSHATRHESATRGGNAGGEAGESSLLVNPDLARSSWMVGAPGGGGGHGAAGRDGDYGTPPSVAFGPLRVGRGGAPRGEPTQTVLTTGAGGGGGGASVSRQIATMDFTAAGGSGGGGGGGALLVVTRGSVRVDGRIVADGGAGGESVRVNGISPGAPGGGGSGGAIVVRALGAVRVASWDGAQVLGGAAGQTVGQNETPFFAGWGAHGRIRLESARSFTPARAPRRSVETRLTARVRDQFTRASDRRLSVESIAGFPPSGVVRVGDEVMRYGSTNEASQRLENVERDLDRLVEHQVGVPVVLLSANVFPPIERPQIADDGLVEDGGLSESDEPPATGTGVDGALRLRFVQGVDPETGAPTIDPQSGAPISLWTFDTEDGVVLAPDGEVFLRAAVRGERRGILELESLDLDAGVVLRVVGPRAPQFLVRGEATIAGTIDVSGEDGGALRFSAPGVLPLAGQGGRAGPGGGAGGDGGNVEFRDGDPENIDAANTDFRAAAAGELPAGIVAARLPDVQPAAGGGPGARCEVGGEDCGPDSAAGGGGGGNLRDGEDGGGDRLHAPDLVAAGGRAFGQRSIAASGELFLQGGGGGGGGGASPDVSERYRAGVDGDFPFPGAARRAPGTGGGGGGGALRIAAASFRLLAGARLLARGGDAFQSIDLGGGGGGGAGGSVYLRAERLEVDPLAQVDVSGGDADRPPPVGADGRPLYEGSGGAAGAPTGWSFGGAGAPGRVRFEVPAGARAAPAPDGALTTPWSVGPFRPGLVPSVARSLPFRLGIAEARSATTPSQRFGPAIVRLAAPLDSGARAVVLWEGALDDRDRLDAPGPFSGPTIDPRDLRQAVWGRFTVHFLVDPTAAEMPAIDSIEVPIEWTAPQRQ